MSSLCNMGGGGGGGVGGGGGGGGGGEFQSENGLPHCDPLCRSALCLPQTTACFSS